MTIGALSECTGVNIETIRYYERIGLLPRPQRSERRQRLYDDGFVQRLRFIRRSRELGFGLEEIRCLLRLSDIDGANCGQVQDIIRGHLADIRGKISDLERLKRQLMRMAKVCEDNQVAACPILDALAKGV
jgi:MerR family transcriptional regulator, mercuric resistance operon regulatory protein